jgi:hypothetical protein
MHHNPLGRESCCSGPTPTWWPMPMLVPPALDRCARAQDWWRTSPRSSTEYGRAIAGKRGNQACQICRRQLGGFGTVCLLLSWSGGVLTGPESGTGLDTTGVIPNRRAPGRSSSVSPVVAARREPLSHPHSFAYPGLRRSCPSASARQTRSVRASARTRWQRPLLEVLDGPIPINRPNQRSRGAAAQAQL